MVCILVAATCSAENSALERASALLQAQRAFATNDYETAWTIYTANSTDFEAGIRDLDLDFLEWLMKRCHKEYGEGYGSRFLSLGQAAEKAYHRDPKTDPAGYAESVFLLAKLVPTTMTVRLRGRFTKISEDNLVPGDIRDKALLRIAAIDLSLMDYERVLPVLSELATRTNDTTRTSALLLNAQTCFNMEDFEKAQDALTKLPSTMPAASQAQAASLRDATQKRLAELDKWRRMPIPCFGPFDVVDLKAGQPLVVAFEYTTPPYPKQVTFSTKDDDEIVAVQREGDNCRAEILVAHGKAIPRDGILQVEKDDEVQCSLTREFKASAGYRHSHTNRYAMHQRLAVKSVRTILDANATKDPSPNDNRR